MTRFNNAAWADPAYLAAQTDDIVKHEILDARENILHGPKEERAYEAAREHAWVKEFQRRGLSL